MSSANILLLVFAGFVLAAIALVLAAVLGRLFGRDAQSKAKIAKAVMLVTILVGGLAIAIAASALMG